MRSSKPIEAVQAQVAAEMVERAAAQYAVIQKDKSLEPCLDGLSLMRKLDAHKEKALSKALALTVDALPGIKWPEKPNVPVSDLLAAASGAKLAVSNLTQASEWILGLPQWLASIHFRIDGASSICERPVLVPVLPSRPVTALSDSGRRSERARARLPVPKNPMERKE